MVSLTDIPVWMDCRTGSGNERQAPRPATRKRDQELADARECRKLLDKAKRKRAAEAKRRRRERKKQQ